MSKLQVSLWLSPVFSHYFRSCFLIRYTTAININNEIVSSNPGIGAFSSAPVFSSDGGVGTGVGAGVPRGTDVGVEIGVTVGGVVVITFAGVGVAVGLGVTCHVHVCISDNSVDVSVAITETFQVPTTKLVFV
ncbi:hypothetical protein DRN97_12015 [Methanosarcinales archaeon]|nr:MAG: hypothetical protein DRN97_12015 [Methanosarcinales archaeon]